MRSNINYCLAFVALTFAAICMGTAQEITGTASGLIRDESGSVIENASVSIRDMATNTLRSTRTNDEGYYVFPFLQPGTYQLTVEKSAFETFVRQAIRLNVNQRLRLDVTLTLGSVTQNIVVDSAPPMLETDNGSLGQTVDTRSIHELPNLQRNPLNIMYLSPGIAPNTYDREATTAAGPQASVNGGRPDDNEVLLDGGSTISLSSNIAVLNPSIDSISETRILTNAYTAEFGRAIGGTMNITTKSGANTLHGSLFEFNRVSALAARNFFDPRKLRFTRNQYGGSIGGPVVLPHLYNGRNKTFFFASYEGIRYVSGLTNIGTLPTDAMRSGDFSRLTTIYDPASTAKQNGVSVRQPFPGNRIPSSSFDTVALNILKYYPAPDRPGGASNYVLSLPVTAAEDRYSGRADHNFGDKNYAFVRYLYDNPNNSTTNNSARTLPDVRVDPSLPQQPVPQQLVIGDTQIISSQTVNDFRFTFFRFFSTQFPGSMNQNFPSKLGLTGVSDELFPLMSVSGYLPIGHANINDTAQNLFSSTDTLSRTVGRHSLKIGGGLSRFQFNNAAQGALSGSFSFDQLPTAQPGQTGTGQPFASFLLGYPTNTSVETYRPTFGYRWLNVGSFVQDDIRVSSNFTMNLGLRYEVETPVVEVNNRQSTFNPTTGTFIVAGQDGASRALSNTDWHNFGPRVGFAWTPSDRAQVVIRGGYGIFYASTSSSQVQQSRSTGFTQIATFTSPDSGVTLPIRLDQGIPPISFNPLAITTQQNISTNVIERNGKRAQIQEWNLNLERQFGSFLVQATYAGSKGTHLIAASYNLNQVPDQLLAPGNAQSLRPYPNFQNIIVNNPNEANSIYNSGYISVNRRFARGPTLIGSFTFQKLIDTSSGRGAIAPQDNYNFEAERAISQFDRTKRFVIGWVWDLPYFRRTKGFKNALLANWEMSGMIEAMDGMPLAMSVTPNLTNSLGGNPRPNRVAGVDPIMSNPTPQEYFNVLAYAPPSPYTFGNVSRTEPQLRGPGWQTVDLSVMKNFHVGEKVNVEFRAEGYNVVNRVNFQAPNTTLGSPQFGQITQAWQPRRIQFGLHLSF
jgi:hypothetical protein